MTDDDIYIYLSPAASVIFLLFYFISRGCAESASVIWGSDNFMARYHIADGYFFFGKEFFTYCN